MDIFDRLLSGTSVIGVCSAEALENLDVRIEAFSVGIAKKPSHYISDAKSVVVVGSCVDFSEDVYKRGLITGGYPGYGKAYQLSKEVKHQLNRLGYKAMIAHELSQKNAAVAAGIGVWGKNSLIINEIFGTRLRFDAVVTDWLPNKYSKRLDTDLCGTCTSCIDACPYQCLEPYKVDAKACFCEYIDKSTRDRVIPMCPVCQRICKYNHGL